MGKRRESSVERGVVEVVNVVRLRPLKCLLHCAVCRPLRKHVQLHNV